MESPTITAESLKDLDIQLETHVFTCIKYKDTPDAGFTSNLYLLIEAVQHSDKVQDENIKLLAKGILNSVSHHKIIKHDMEQVNKNLLEARQKKAEEEALKEVVPEINNAY